MLPSQDSTISTYGWRKKKEREKEGKGRKKKKRKVEGGEYAGDSSALA